MLLAASRIKPSEEINSVYTTSAPWSLHKARKGGSLTSSMGAKSSGNSPTSMLPIFANSIKLSWQNYEKKRKSP